jgi:glycosyltransferase involved in cell wall biosynthesis
MRILIATDAWRPQVNGVVSTLERMTHAAAEFGAKFDFLTPQGMWTAPLPTYPDIRLALPSVWGISERIEAAAPDHIHIATEGPIGWLTRRYCLKNKRIFTTSYHTRFPEYVAARTGLPKRVTYAGLRFFHAPSAAVMAPTATIAGELTRRRFARVKLWTRGVNHGLFHPRPERTLDLPRPIFLSVGRLAVEKNLEALLELDLPGSTVIVGDGPARPYLERRYPRAHFLGAMYGEALADVYASADVFVFPSRTDTFGIVLLEALASGVPVAAFPAPGPIDVIDSGAGVLDTDLRAACLKALEIPRESARASSLRFSWRESARQFLDNIESSRVSPPARAPARAQPKPKVVSAAESCRRG